MRPFNLPSSVVQNAVAIGIDCGGQMQFIAQEPSGFLTGFFVSNRLLESLVSKASPEELPMTLRVSLGRDRDVIMEALNSGDISLERGTEEGLPPPLISTVVSMCLATGTTLGDVTSLCFLVITGGLRSPWPSTAMFMPMYGGAVTTG